MAKSCLTLWEPMDCSLPSSSVHGISQARILKWDVISFSRGLPDPGIKPMSSVLEGRFFTSLASREDRDKTCLHMQFIVAFQFLSSVQLFVIPWTAAYQASLTFTIFWSLLRFVSIESVMLSNHLILCHPFLLLPSIFPNIRVFSSEKALQHHVAEVLELQLQHLSFQWVFRVDFL